MGNRWGWSSECLAMVIPVIVPVVTIFIVISVGVRWT